ncbi:hypothetical protein AB0F88_38875 [Streptosporangium sp. NPDC023963]|uniref:hypothetical protein n=1 Tax=Streptosporangium sp. NPDC023963 TaxID=3155608 RepID=UPI003417E785
MLSDTSIATGIGEGFVTFVLIKAVKGRAREVHPLRWTVAGLFVVHIALGPAKILLNLG